MIVAIGIDIVDITRIEEILARRGDRFCRRVYTERERDYCERRASPVASYAVRFAAKEAVMKALGTGWADGISWQDIEVVRKGEGAPTIELKGRALQRLRELGARKAHISLSHSRDLAVAQVVLED